MRYFLILMFVWSGTALATRIDPYGDFMNPFMKIYSDCKQSDAPKPCSPTYGVLEKGPIAAHYPQQFFGTTMDRRWRGSTLEYPDLIKKGREGVDHWTQPGTVLVLESWRVGKGTIRLTWSTADNLVPSEHPKRKAAELGFELVFLLPKEWTYGSHEKEILAWLASWVRPFGCENDARAYANKDTE